MTRRKLDISKNELRNLKEMTENEASDNLRGLVEVHNSNQKDQTWLELPIPPNKELRKWPLISFGDHAPTPRWRIIRDQPDPADGRDLSQDLIRTRTGRTIIDGLRPGDVARSFDSNIGLGGLAWKFDPGVASGWVQLDEAQLYEFAFRCLETALADHGAREQFRNAIFNMSIGNSIAHVEDPLPPIPPAPPKSDFGVLNGLLGVNEVTTPVENIHWYWDGYKRPSLAIREGCNGTGGGLSARPTNTLVDRMFFHMAGTIGRSANVSPTYDSDSHDSDSSTSSLA